MHRYWVAAEGMQRMPGSGIAGAKSWLSPAGLLHAVEPASERVACGQALRQLVPFREMHWDAIRSGLRCPDCVRAMSEQPTAGLAPGPT